jgi:hypothetical protein
MMTGLAEIPQDKRGCACTIDKVEVVCGSVLNNGARDFSYGLGWAERLLGLDNVRKNAVFLQDLLRAFYYDNFDDEEFIGIEKSLWYKVEPWPCGDVIDCWSQSKVRDG